MFCDPIAIDESITLTLIIFLKELFESKLELDIRQCYQRNSIKNMKTYLKGFKGSKNIFSGKWLPCCNETKVKLHGFCDSLGTALGTVVYAGAKIWYSIKLICGQWSVTLLNQLKPIPCLDLSCLLLALLVTDFLKAIKGKNQVTEVH